MRICFVLPGLHRVHRGAEVAFESVATELGRAGDSVTLIGSGRPIADRPYRFLHAPLVERERFERFPKVPFLRSEFMYEDASFVPGLLARYRPADFDATVTCSFPYVHWALGRPARRAPAHVFVTQNGTWPLESDAGEARWFSCDGLVCTNPEYLARHGDDWFSTLIPNGVDLDRFGPGPAERERLGLPADVPVVLMVSAAMASKRVDAAIRAMAEVPDAHLVVAGDGPERDLLDALAAELIPGRFTRLTLPAADMGALYRSADVFLHTTLFESFGNVYIEAMATGLPVVAHDSSVTRWILGDHARLVDTTDAAVLAQALRDALVHGTGRPAAAAAEAAARFSWTSVGAQYRDFLAQVVARRG